MRAIHLERERLPSIVWRGGWLAGWSNESSCRSWLIGYLLCGFSCEVQMSEWRKWIEADDGWKLLAS
eukprot:scaffold1323_cov106-Skeletonema_marinoi.AAC.7